MKIDRLIGIITTLQQNKKVTAPYLAEKFEVSRRTIQRDIETICQAGIPIVTTQGSNGGISLMDGFSLDTAVFTQQKLVSLTKHMQIDLASFYKDDLASKIGLIRQALRGHRCISFHYYYNKGEADKLIEPYQLVFKWSDWYVFGYCREYQDFRLYKLRRLWWLEISSEIYEERVIPEEKKHFGSHMTDDYIITAVYDSSVKYKLVEEYGPQSFTELEDGSLYTEWGFTKPEDAMYWFLGFGDKVKVTSPPEMVEKMKNALQSAVKNYI